MSVRIVHVFKDAHPPVAAGITRYMGDLAAASAARGHEVEVLVAGVRRERVDQRPDGVAIRRVPEWGRALSMPLSPALVAETSRIEADIVHLHLPNPLSELGALRARGARGLVASFHAQLGKQRLLAPIFGPLQRAALKRSDRVFASSEILAGAPELSSVQDRVVLAPYGVSPQMVGATPAQPERRAGRLRVLFVGRLVYYKGVDVLLDAMVGLPDLTLTIMGDGVLRPQIEERLAADADLARRVELVVGASDAEVMEQHRCHDVVVLPSVSRAEAFGLSMAEAMANGLPAISTRLGTGTDWVNLDGVSGLTVEPDDVDALRAALEAMCDDDARARWAAGAHERAHSTFSFDRHAELVHQHYEAVLDREPIRFPWSHPAVRGSAEAAS